MLVLRRSRSHDLTLRIHDQRARAAGTNINA
jgi:hypothetical protein